MPARRKPSPRPSPGACPGSGWTRPACCRAWIADVRDLTLSFSAGASTDVSIGRQVITWGTGDLVFLNDLFPKDFVSFFAGRDDDYLKAPGDAPNGPMLELTYNWGVKEYDLGAGYGHVALQVDSMDEVAERLKASGEDF